MATFGAAWQVMVWQDKARYGAARQGI